MPRNRRPACYVRSDGSCLGNPGPVSWAYTVVIRRGRGWNDPTLEGSGAGLPDGRADGTNNEAEYAGVYEAVARIHREGLQPRVIHIFTDSMLVAKQLSEEWKVKEPRMAELVARIFGQARRIGACTVLATWIPREFLRAEDAAARNAHAKGGGV